jgi:hypothetical protein
VYDMNFQFLFYFHSTDKLVEFSYAAGGCGDDGGGGAAAHRLVHFSVLAFVPLPWQDSSIPRVDPASVLIPEVP